MRMKNKTAANLSLININNRQGKPVPFRMFCPVAAVFIVVLATGCSSMSYKPAVSLGISPQTIKANVQLETFVDQSPQSDKEGEFSGFSACEPGTLEGDLATDVTEAILTDFNNNQVFESIKMRFETEPDLIMKGTIHRYYGKFGPTAAMWITIPIDIIWFLGIPVESDDGEVDLEVSIQRPDGTVLGIYHGQSSLSGSYSIYYNAALGLPTRLNEAFSESVAQIRDQILKDARKLETNQTATTNQTTTK
jgi:hypothetical protein